MIRANIGEPAKQKMICRDDPEYLASRRYPAIKQAITTRCEPGRTRTGPVVLESREMTLARFIAQGFRAMLMGSIDMDFVCAMGVVLVRIMKRLPD